MADQGVVDRPSGSRRDQTDPEERSQVGSLSIEQLDRRRAQLWGLSLALLIATFAGAAFLIFGEEFLPDPLRESEIAPYITAVLVVALGLAFVLYTAEKEKDLRDLVHLIIEDRERIARLEQLDELRRDFLAVASHDLKTPLTSIIGASKTLTQHGDSLDPEMRRSFIESIERQGMRMLEMIQDVLETSRIESGALKLKRELVDLRELVNRLASDLLGTTLGNGRRLEVRFSPHDPQMWGDKVATQQVLTNLVENGFKYALDPIVIEAREETNEVILSVTDAGPGIPEERLDTLFDRFKQVEDDVSSGFGLGLFIVASLVEAQGGSISVTSAVGHPTAFTIRYPKRAADRS